MSNKKLTPKQQRFIDEYLIDLNATQAAIRAGYVAKYANTNASKLLQNTAIDAAITAAQKKISERNLVTQDDVIKGLLKEAAFEGDGSSHSARVSAWEKLGKSIGMFKDKVEHTGKDGEDLSLNIKVSYE